MSSLLDIDITLIDNIKRIQSAKEISSKKIRVDRKGQTATIIGSSFDTYTVSLSECTCYDFSMRRKPCKHMIRLAIELGDDFGFPAFSPQKAKEYDVETDIAILRKRWLDGQLLTESYIACINALMKSAAKAK